jgi:hypothetical protein
MFFTRTHSSTISMPKQEIINRLLGKHVRIHNIDFEIYEEEGYLHIIPHTEQEESIKTLPDTRLELVEKGNTTKVIATFKMRQLDSGGPFLIVIFCAFLFIASAVLFFVGGSGEQTITYTLLGIGSLILILFSIRMQTGYFDYIRKIRAFINGKESAATDTTLPVMQA